MRIRTTFLIVSFCLAAVPGRGDAQHVSQAGWGVPAWVDSALTAAGVSGYASTSNVNPQWGWGDFDGDGFYDIAIDVVATGSRARGILIVHRIDRSVHIVGAGQPLGSGGARNELGSAGWAIERLAHQRDVLRVDGQMGTLHGWVAWNGRDYVWVQD
jgi:hypothetical protein